MRVSKRTALKELEKRIAPSKFDVSNFLFDKQLAFQVDPSPFKTAVCSRRSGKTIACAADLVDTAINNVNVVCVYITLSRKTAKKIIWKELREINRNYSLGAKEDSTDLSMTFPNSSVIYVSGAKDATEIEKFRGLPIKLCYIDESQSFRAYIQTLIDDIIAPALMDYAGKLCLIGTPGPVPAGYFYNCSTQNNVWSKHAWTFFDNPFIATKSKTTHRALLDRELERKGVLVTDASVQREWFGRWVMDSDSLLLKYNSVINNYKVLREGKMQYCMGIDLGFVDADAIAVIGWYEDSKTVYLVEESIMNKQGLTELVAEIERLRKKYDIANLIIDEGGLGKKLAEEMRRRYHIPVQAAEKARKMENIAFLNDALRTGRFLAKHDSRFAQDSYLVEIDIDKSTPDKIKVKDNFHSDIIDAVLYAFKKSPAYAYTAPEAKPQPDTPQYFAKLEEDMFQASLERALEDAENKKSEDPYG